jgi:hypothetical protein
MGAARPPTITQETSMTEKSIPTGNNERTRSVSQAITVKLHDTDIVRYDRKADTLVVAHGGFVTVSTSRHINDALRRHRLPWMVARSGRVMKLIGTGDNDGNEHVVTSEGVTVKAGGSNVK